MKSMLSFQAAQTPYLQAPARLFKRAPETKVGAEGFI
jgi:hypothetical protein